MELIKTLIVDDEVFVAQSLKALLDWEALGFEITAVCHSGKSALAEIEKGQVELLLCDVKMPEMSGIDLVQQVSAQFPQIENIIISGYSDFAYAQSAIRYGTTAYCLKPFDEEELSAALDLAREKILNKRAKLTNDILTELLFLSGGIPAERLREDLEKLGFDPARPVYVCVLLGCVCDFSSVAHSQGMRVGSQKYIYLLQPHTALHSVLDTLRTVCARSAASAGLDRIGRKLRITAHIERARQSAMQFFYTAKKEPVVYESPQVRPPKKKRDLLALLPPQGMTQAQKDQYAEHIRQVFTECRYTIQDAYYFYHLISAQYLPAGCKEVFHCDSYEAMAEEFLSLEEMLRQTVQTGPGEIVNISDSQSWIQPVKEYCEKNYTEPISITIVSDMLHISPSYFSTLFKKVTGENFTAYVTSLRLEKACEQLTATEKNISDIAIDVGYSDYFYFAKVFRKHFRATPTEYREQHRRTKLTEA